MGIHENKIISLAKEYVENTPCFCKKTTPCCVCWRCLFEYNLNFIKAKDEETIKESKDPDNRQTDI